MVTNIYQMSVSHLSSDAQNIIKRLNSERLFFAGGLPRDWRGLATLVGLTSQDAEKLFAMKVLEIWVRRDENSKVHHLFRHLQTIDRYDLYDDLKELVSENRLIDETEKWTTESEMPQNTGDDIRLTKDDEVEDNKLVFYDALVYHADAEPENEFADALIKIMTGIGFKMVRKSDLLSDVMPLTAMIELISTRCRHVIFILSPAYSQSPEHQFLTQYVHAKKVVEHSHQMILCELETCERPKELRFYKPLNYKTDKDFWKKLAWHVNGRRTPRLCIPDWVHTFRYTPANGHSSVTASTYPVNGSVADGADTTLVADGGQRQRFVTNVANDSRRPPPNSNVRQQLNLTPHGFVGNARYASGWNSQTCNGFVVNHPVAGGFSENMFVGDTSIADEFVANESSANGSVAIKCLAYDSVAKEADAEESVVDDSVDDNGQDADGTADKVTDGHLKQSPNQYIVNIHVVSEPVDTHSNGSGQLSNLQTAPDGHPTIKLSILADVSQWCRKRTNILRNKLYPKRLKDQQAKSNC